MKNLPKHVAEDHLRKEFSRKGEITDVQLKRTKYLNPLLIICSFDFIFVFCF